LGDIEGFKREFEARAIAFPGVTKVLFFGSIAEHKFVQGKSDVDVAIYGRVALEDKKKIREILKELNYKYGMGLERAPFLHPTPFFVPPEREWLFRETFNGHLHLAFLFVPYRELAKRFPMWTYKDWWKWEDKLAPAYELLYPFW